MGQGANFCWQGAAPFKNSLAGALHFLMQPVQSYDSHTASFSASVFFFVFFVRACIVLKFARKRFLFSSLPSSAILRSQPRIDCINRIHWAQKTYNSQSEGRLENRFMFGLKEWTEMDRITPPK